MRVIEEQHVIHINTLTIKLCSSIQRGSVGELICPLPSGLPGISHNASTG